MNFKSFKPINTPTPGAAASNTDRPSYNVKQTLLLFLHFIFSYPLFIILQSSSFKAIGFGEIRTKDK